MRPGFVVAAIVLNNSNGDIIKVTSKQLFIYDIAIKEARATLLAVQTIINCGVYSLMVKAMLSTLLLPLNNLICLLLEISLVLFFIFIFICFLFIVGKP
jgi:hypothetical protein